MPKTKGALALASYDDIFQIVPAVQTSVEQVQEVPLDELFSFENHSFQARDDEGMQETAESVKNTAYLCLVLCGPGWRVSMKLLQDIAACAPANWPERPPCRF